MEILLMSIPPKTNCVCINIIYPQWPYEYKVFFPPPKTKLNLMNKQNKLHSKMFGSKNHKLYKIKLWLIFIFILCSKSHYSYLSYFLLFFPFYISGVFLLLMFCLFSLLQVEFRYWKTQKNVKFPFNLKIC